MPIGDLLAQISGEPSPTLPSATPYIPKRKASGDLSRPVEKMQRTNSNTLPTGSTRPIAQVSRSSTVNTSMAKMNLTRKPIVASPTTTFQNGRPTPPLTTDPSVPAKAPKKGSFAEIMARGKQAQASLMQVGKIQHKKIEKAPTKREREDMKSQKVARIQKVTGPNGKFSSAASKMVGRSGERKEGRPAPILEKKPKKAAAATTGYTGTARPKPGSVQPASRSSASSVKAPDRYRDERRTAQRYVSEEEDDEQDYASDASSDMEAAAFEVDEEEEFASRAARREDAEALAEENRLKREKEEKKRRLAAMAKSRR